MLLHFDFQSLQYRLVTLRLLAIICNKCSLKSWDLFQLYTYKLMWGWRLILVQGTIFGKHILTRNSYQKIYFKSFTCKMVPCNSCCCSLAMFPMIITYGLRFRKAEVPLALQELSELPQHAVTCMHLIVTIKSFFHIKHWKFTWIIKYYLIKLL